MSEVDWSCASVQTTPPQLPTAPSLGIGLPIGVPQITNPINATQRIDVCNRTSDYCYGLGGGADIGGVPYPVGGVTIPVSQPALIGYGVWAQIRIDSRHLYDPFVVAYARLELWDVDNNVLLGTSDEVQLGTDARRWSASVFLFPWEGHVGTFELRGTYYFYSVDTHGNVTELRDVIMSHACRFQATIIGSSEIPTFSDTDKILAIYRGLSPILAGILNTVLGAAQQPPSAYCAISNQIPDASLSAKLVLQPKGTSTYPTTTSQGGVPTNACWVWFNRAYAPVLKGGLPGHALRLFAQFGNNQRCYEITQPGGLLFDNAGAWNANGAVLLDYQQCCGQFTGAGSNVFTLVAITDYGTYYWASWPSFPTTLNPCQAGVVPCYPAPEKPCLYPL